MTLVFRSTFVYLAALSKCQTSRQVKLKVITIRSLLTVGTKKVASLFEKGCKFQYNFRKDSVLNSTIELTQFWIEFRKKISSGMMSGDENSRIDNIIACIIVS